MLKELLDRARERKQMKRAMEDEFNIHYRLMEKRKSANERELERFHEEARQARIKKELDFHRKKRQHEFYNGATIMKNNKKLLSNTDHKEKPLLKQKSLLKSRRLFK